MRVVVTGSSGQIGAPRRDLVHELSRGEPITGFGREQTIVDVERAGRM